MKIRTLKALVYKDVHMYIRNFGNLFEYLVVIDGQVYTAFICVRKTFLQWLLRKDYTPAQLTGVVQYLSKIAETTVDTVLQMGKK